MTARKQKQPHRLNPPTEIYKTLVRELDRRRRALGLTHDQLCERAGIGQRHWATYLRPEASSGRIASWMTLQKLFVALYPAGFHISPNEDQLLSVVSSAIAEGGGQ